MKKLMLVTLVAVLAVSLTAGCSKNSTKPEEEWYLKDAIFDVYWDNGMPADNITLRVVGSDTTFFFDVIDGVMVVNGPLLGNYYKHTFLNEKGEEIEVDLGNGEITTTFIMTPEELVKVKSLALIAKPVIPTTGSLLIESTPSGATVYLDGVEVGVTPCSKDEITPGSHALKLVLEGYEDKEEKVVIKAGETAELSLELQVYLPHGFDPDTVPWEGVWADLTAGGTQNVTIEIWDDETWIAGFDIAFKKVGKTLVPYTGDDSIAADGIYASKEEGKWLFTFTYRFSNGNSTVKQYRKM